MTADVENRILVVDDNRDVHQDFRKVLCPDRASAQHLDSLEEDIFGDTPAPRADAIQFQIDSAYQGQEALELVKRSLRCGRPYALAFVDMRMPPGWDGIETISRLWAEDPDLQIIICSAYSDYSWRDIVAKLGQSDRLLILKKPFDSSEAIQIACAFSRKWALHREARRHTHHLESMVQSRTQALEEVNLKLREEIDEKVKMESALRLAQKLEAVGRLAAGIAHEINTPIQFVGDSLSFVRDSVRDINFVLEHYADLHRAILEGSTPSEAALALRNILEELDVSYLVEHVPAAIERSLEGLSRVATIVRSMKQFAHPDQSDMEDADLNDAIRTTLTVARNEYKFVADVETSFGELPRVKCRVGEINQAILNIVVNAAHAIEESIAAGGERGVIAIGTRHEGDDVTISISDTGGGIPSAVRDKIFDPFFTTKEVGRGTGQGLAIARSAIMEKHDGVLTFESEPGRGTTFFIRLPIEGSRSAASGRVSIENPADSTESDALGRARETSYQSS